MAAQFHTIDSLRKILEARITRLGGYHEAGRLWQISPGYLCDIVIGRRRPGPKVMKALGFAWRAVDEKYL
jgi:hypothetical protein